MENFIVYGGTALFFVSVLPVYVSVYAYADSGKKYASANFCLYRIFRFLNVNTEEDGRIMSNVKEAGINPAASVRDGKIALDNLCVFKIIQLSDFGLGSEKSAYAALLQSAVTFPLYSYIDKSGSACKLRHYVVLNAEPSEIKYCAEAVRVIHTVVALQLAVVLVMGRI